MNLRLIFTCILAGLVSFFANSSVTGKAIGFGPLLGDVNQDTVINFNDIVPFCTALTTGPYVCEADINVDGVVNLQDVQSFAIILSSQQTATFTPGATVAGQSDFFWSTNGFGMSALNGALSLNVPAGVTRKIYLYYTTSLAPAATPMLKDIDTGVALNVATSTPGVVKFTAGETFNPVVTIGGVASNRWQQGSFSGTPLSVADDLIIGLTAFSFCPDTNGMVFANTTAPMATLIDAGYDTTADAFLYGSVDVEGVKAGCTVSLLVGPNNLGILNVSPVIQTFGEVNITTILLGDVNTDGVTNLLDVDPFVDLIGNGQFQAEADINLDGSVNLLDVNSFIDIISGS